MIGLLPLSENWMGCWINGLIKFLFERFQPNELLIMWCFLWWDTDCVPVCVKSLLPASQSAFPSRLLRPIIFRKSRRCSSCGLFITFSIFAVLCPNSSDLNWKMSLVDAPLVTWSGWMEPKSPAFTPCVRPGRVTEEHAWPSHPRNSPATAPKVTEDATVKQRWPSTGRTWAWASALSSPSASASWLY